MRTCTAFVLFLLGTAIVPSIASAQSDVAGRVDRLEGQMRAVQRKVFPPINGKLVQPEITAGETPTEIGGAPSNSAVSDLTARVDALESQLRTMTGQIEQNQFRQRQLDEGFTAYRNATDKRLRALEGGAVSPAAGPAAPDEEPAPIAGPKAVTPKPVSTKLPVTTAAGKTTPPVAATRDPARAERLAAVEKPATDDAGEDAYNYGYRLWEAKLYPEAETQFKSVAKDYPGHRRISRAQNMLGRSLLDSGKPNLAVLAFYDNYRTLPKGDRAHESLYYLAQALTQLKKPASEICKVYDELTQVYPDKLNPEMKAGVARGRTAQKCGK